MEVMRRKRRDRVSGKQLNRHVQDILNALRIVFRKQANVYGWQHAVKQLSEVFIKSDLDRTCILGPYELELFLENVTGIRVSKSNQCIDKLCALLNPTSVPEKQRQIQFHHISSHVALDKQQSSDRSELLFKKLERVVDRKFEGKSPKFFEYYSQPWTTPKQAGLTKLLLKVSDTTTQQQKSNSATSARCITYESFNHIIRHLQIGSDSMSPTEIHCALFQVFASKMFPGIITRESFILGYKTLKRSCALARVRRNSTDSGRLESERKLRGTQELVLVDLAFSVNKSEAESFVSLQYQNLGVWPCVTSQTSAISTSSYKAQSCYLWCRRQRESDFNSLKQFSRRRISSICVIRDSDRVPPGFTKLQPGFLVEDNDPINMNFPFAFEEELLSKPNNSSSVDENTDSVPNHNVSRVQKSAGVAKQILRKLIPRTKSSANSKSRQVAYLCVKRDQYAQSVVTSVALTFGDYSTYCSPLWAAPGKAYNCVAHGRFPAPVKKSPQTETNSDLEHVLIWTISEMAITIDGTERVKLRVGLDEKHNRTKENEKANEIGDSVQSVNVALKDLGPKIRSQLRLLSPNGMTMCNVSYIMAEFQRANGRIGKKNIKELFNLLGITLDVNEWEMVLSKRAPAVTSSSLMSIVSFCPSTVAEYLCNTFLNEVLAEKTISDVEDSFLQVDVKGSGFISQESFVDVFKSQFQLLTTSTKFKQVLLFFDTEEDERVNYERFVNVVTAFQHRLGKTQATGTLETKGTAEQTVADDSNKDDLPKMNEGDSPPTSNSTVPKTSSERVTRAIKELHRELVNQVFQCKANDPILHRYNYLFSQDHCHPSQAQEALGSLLIKYFPDAMLWLSTDIELKKLTQYCFSCDPIDIPDVTAFQTFIDCELSEPFTFTDEINHVSRIPPPKKLENDGSKVTQHIVLGKIVDEYKPSSQTRQSILSMQYGRHAVSLYDHMLRELKPELTVIKENAPVQVSETGGILISLEVFHNTLSKLNLKLTRDELCEMYPNCSELQEITNNCYSDDVAKYTSDTWVDICAFSSSLSNACGTVGSMEQVENALRKSVASASRRGVSTNQIFEDVLRPSNSEEIALRPTTFIVALTQLGIKWPSREVQAQVFEKVDVDQDGRISLGDWNQYLLDTSIAGSKSLKVFHRAASSFRISYRNAMQLSLLSTSHNSWQCNRLLWGSFLHFDPLKTGKVLFSDFLEGVQRITANMLPKQFANVLARHFSVSRNEVQVSSDSLAWRASIEDLVAYDQFCWYFEERRLSDEVISSVRKSVRARAAKRETCLLVECRRREIFESEQQQPGTECGLISRSSLRKVFREGLADWLTRDDTIEAVCDAFEIPQVELPGAIEAMIDYEALCDTLAPTETEINEAYREIRPAIFAITKLESHVPSATKLLNMYDERNKGYLSRTEFVKLCLERFGLGNNLQYALVLVEHFDRHGNDKITVNHLQELFRQVTTGSQHLRKVVSQEFRTKLLEILHAGKEDLISAFRCYDHARSGKIDRVSFDVVCRKLGIQVTHQDFKEILEIFTQYNDSSEGIEYEKFLIHILRVAGPGGTLDNNWKLPNVETEQKYLEPWVKSTNALSAHNLHSPRKPERANVPVSIVPLPSKSTTSHKEHTFNNRSLEYERTGYWKCQVCHNQHTQVRFLQRCEMCSSVNIFAWRVERANQHDNSLPYPFNSRSLS